MLDFLEAKLLFSNVKEGVNITRFAVTIFKEFSRYQKSGLRIECFKQKCVPGEI